MKEINGKKSDRNLNRNIYNQSLVSFSLAWFIFITYLFFYMLRLTTKLTEAQQMDYIRKMYKIAGVGMKLYNELGFGYSEPIYQECLSILCEENHIPWAREKVLNMFYHNRQLNKQYQADFVCYGDIIVELKAVKELTGEHRAQLFNYLRITQSHAGLLMNFGEVDRLHTEKYLFNPDTNKYEIVHGGDWQNLKCFPATNIEYDSLR